MRLRSILKRQFGVPELPLEVGEQQCRQDVVDVLSGASRIRAVATLTSERWVVQPLGSVFSFRHGAPELEVRRGELLSVDRVARVSGALRGGFPGKPSVLVRLTDGSAYRVFSWRLDELADALSGWRETATVAELGLATPAEEFPSTPRPRGPTPQTVDLALSFGVMPLLGGLVVVLGLGWLLLVPVGAWLLLRTWLLKRYARWRLSGTAREGGRSRSGA